MRSPFVHETAEPLETLHAVTRRSIQERLVDPYLTDHDRWVLGQFALFLAGAAPAPDPRVERTATQRPLYARIRHAAP